MGLVLIAKPIGMSRLLGWLFEREPGGDSPGGDSMGRSPGNEPIYAMASMVQKQL
jgi:hypothetical protein